MPHYKIEGLDRETGESFIETVEATTENEAIKQVDLLVSKVTRVPKPFEPAPMARPVTEQYEGLITAGVLLRVAGVLGLIAGVVLLIVGFGSLAEGDGITVLAMGISIFIGGALIMGIGEGLRALRDIAIAVTRTK